MTLKVTFRGKDVLFSERHTTLPSSEAQALETLPKPVWPRAQSSLITGHKVTSTPAPSPMHRGRCRKEWVGPKPHQTGESPPTAEAAAAATLGTHHSPTAGPYQGGAGHPPRPRGLPGSVPRLREVPASGSGANTRHPMFGFQLQGPGPPEQTSCAILSLWGGAGNESFPCVLRTSS